MARIRSIKPEFWIDETLTECSLGARLLFIALWNFADDQGYVDDKPKRIKAQVFPSDDIDVVPLLEELVSRGRLVRYDSPIGPVLHIRNFDRHQRVDKPSKARFDASSLTPREPSRPTEPERKVVPASLATEGKGSGREGKGREVPPTAGNSLALVPLAEPSSTDQLIGEWIAHCDERPPKNVIGQVSKHVKTMLDEGVSPQRVRAGLAAWHQKGDQHPSVLPSMVYAAQNGRSRASPRSTADTRFADAAALASHYREIDGE